MANYAWYTAKFVSRDRKVLDKLAKIMDYKDPDYYLYRVFSAERDEPELEDGLWTMTVSGDVAWSVHSWFEGVERPDDVDDAGGHYVTLDILAKRLCFGVEAFCEEEGVGFQEWHRCDRHGNHDSDCADWSRKYEDEDGNELDEPEDEGGLDGFEEWSAAEEIYGTDGEG